MSFCWRIPSIFRRRALYLSRNVLKKFGFDIGLAFQIIDDILDVEGEENKLGKQVNKDNRLGKKNLVSNYGLNFSREEARKLVEKANKDINDVFGKKSIKLQELAEFIISRDS